MGLRDHLLVPLLLDVVHAHVELVGLRGGLLLLLYDVMLLIVILWLFVVIVFLVLHLIMMCRYGDGLCDKIIGSYCKRENLVSYTHIHTYTHTHTRTHTYIV